MTDPTIPHDHTADHCECPNCRNTLAVKGPAASGIAPGHLYIHCNGCGYHYTFPKWCQRITRRSPALVVSAGSSSRKHVVRHSSHGVTVADKQCATTTCTKGANTLCSNKSCKNCCITKGGCKISSHHRDMLSKRERKKIAHLMPAPRPYSFRPPSPLIELSHPPLTMSPPSVVERSASIFDDWPNPVRDMENRRILEEKERIERECAEAEAEEQEEREYQAALAASLGLDYTSHQSWNDNMPSASSSHTPPVFDEGDKHAPLLLPSLLDNIEEPLARFTLEFRIHGRVAVFLTELMRDLVLVQEMPHIHAHTNAIEPWVFHSLLLGIAIGVIEDVFRLLRTRNRECILDHDEEIRDSLCTIHRGPCINHTARPNQGLFVVGTSSVEEGLDGFECISGWCLGWTRFICVVCYSDCTWIFLRV